VNDVLTAGYAARVLICLSTKQVGDYFLSERYCLQRNAEFCVFCGLIAVFALLGIITATGSPLANRQSTGNAVVAFSWILAAASAASAAIAFIESRRGERDEECAKV
jgi:hypothetical protein